MANFLQGAHIVGGLYPVADAFATSGTTDRVSIVNYGKTGFLISTGAGGTADGVVTVTSFAAVSGGSATAVPFDYRVSLSSTTVDTWSTTTRAAAAGFAMTAGNNYKYWIEVDAELVASTTTNTFLALLVTEDTDSPCLAGIDIFGLDPRYPQDLPVSMIA